MGKLLESIAHRLHNYSQQEQVRLGINSEQFILRLMKIFAATSPVEFKIKFMQDNTSEQYDKLIVAIEAINPENFEQYLHNITETDRSSDLALRRV